MVTRRLVRRGSRSPHQAAVVPSPTTEQDPPLGEATLGPGLLNVVQRGGSLVIVQRGEDGQVSTRTRPALYSVFVRHDQVSDDLMRQLRDTNRIVEMRVDGEYLCLAVDAEKRWHEELCNRLEGFGVATYEGDVRPVRRYLTDTHQAHAIPRLCFLDLETDSRVPFSRKEEMRVLCWAVVEPDGTKHAGVLHADSDEAERCELAELFSLLEHFDQVAAWNGDRFDFPVLEARCAHVRLQIEFERWLFLDQLEVFRRMNMMAAESGDEKQSYALQAIATALLGEGKDDFDASRTWEAWLAGGAERARMVRYCVNDADLQRRIEDKVGYVALLGTLCTLCNVFPDSTGLNPTVQGEGFLLRLGADRGYRFPTTFKRGGIDSKYRGAYVMEPREKGIVHNVHVGDFASLYPSIIVTWNMSPETLRTEAGVGIAHCPITDAHFDTSSEGILPHAVKEVMRLRAQWNALKASLPPGTKDWVEANRKATAYKIAANSFYGIIGSPMSRFFNRVVAESITQAGAWLIQQTIAAAEVRAMRAIYGDTDSVFIAGCTRFDFQRFVDWCNAELYPKLLTAEGCAENLIKLAYEKEFERIIIACAKKYCGRYVHFKGAPATSDSKPEVKGLEYKRGDAIRLARALQAEIVDLLVGMTNGGHEDPATFEEVLARWQHRVLAEPLELDDVLVSKRLNKGLDEYVRRPTKDGGFARQLPHIELARVLQARGRDVGEGAKVDYYCADGSTKPAVYRAAEDWDGQCDRHDVWERQVAPATLRLLAAAFPASDWKGWAKTRPKKPRAPRRPAKAAWAAGPLPTGPDQETAPQGQPGPLRRRKRKPLG